MWALVTLIAPVSVSALTLELPTNALETGSDTRSLDQVLLPLSPRDGSGGQGLVAEGRVERRAWTLSESEVTPFQILQPVMAQLSDLGFETKYQCRDRDCGGFDFRLALDLLPAPAMHVDLGDFRYAVAEKRGTNGPEIASIVVSRSESGGHVHVTFITPTNSSGQLQTTKTAAVAQPSPTNATDFSASLSAGGRAVLPGLEFRPGSSELGEGPFASLRDLSDWLAGNPDASVILVGHSDNVGGLEDNIRLSERRAAAVVDALTKTYGVDRSRLSSRGIGFLSPIAPNTTPEGRLRNRRVEAVVTGR